MKLISPQQFNFAVSKLRSFFLEKGFLEVHIQNRLSILSACEDPTTIATFEYAGAVWPLPQTGQMWLEYELLNDPALRGVFCTTTSFRNEPNPVEGRHDLIFPMFEFETHGTMKDLMQLERELCEHLGFGSAGEFPEVKYREAMAEFETSILEAEHEELLQQKYGDVVMLSEFPFHTSPFWNMKRKGDTAQKIDVIIQGIETIGSAERSVDAAQMRDSFHTISNGMYANLLYSRFGKERVERELEEFLAFDFFPRVGGGIGMTRMIRAMQLFGQLPMVKEHMSGTIAAQ